MATNTRKHGGRSAGVPYMRGMIACGYDDNKRESFKIDGPLDAEMKKIIKKYGLSMDKLFNVTMVSYTGAGIIIFSMLANILLLGLIGA
jgi:hypothetical protein